MKAAADSEACSHASAFGVALHGIIVDRVAEARTSSKIQISVKRSNWAGLVPRQYLIKLKLPGVRGQGESRADVRSVALRAQ